MWQNEQKHHSMNMDHDQGQNDEARCPCWAPITDIPFPLLSQPSGPRRPREFTMAKAVVPVVPAWLEHQSPIDVYLPGVLLHGLMCCPFCKQHLSLQHRSSIF